MTTLTLPWIPALGVFEGTPALRPTTNAHADWRHLAAEELLKRYETSDGLLLRYGYAQHPDSCQRGCWWLGTIALDNDDIAEAIAESSGLQVRFPLNDANVLKIEEHMRLIHKPSGQPYSGGVEPIELTAVKADPKLPVTGVLLRRLHANAQRAIDVLDIKRARFRETAERYTLRPSHGAIVLIDRLTGECERNVVPFHEGTFGYNLLYREWELWHAGKFSDETINTSLADIVDLIYFREIATVRRQLAIVGSVIVSNDALRAVPLGLNDAPQCGSSRT